MQLAWRDMMNGEKIIQKDSPSSNGIAVKDVISG